MILPKTELTGGLLTASDGRVHGHYGRNMATGKEHGNRQAGQVPEQ